MSTYTTEIIADTPDEGLFEAIRRVQDNPIERNSRNGPTLEFQGPATIVYTNPLNRVLFDPIRDCNPFFALFESLWMLGGRQDLASIVYFNSGFSQYSDDGKFIRGSAYGVRWRSWFGHDQIEAARKEFERGGVDTRRVVIMQWDAATDPVVDSKDVPCNTQCCLIQRDGFLDLTVFNRSNDIIYGTFGSNVVHFSMFLEYMSKLAGLPMGRYYQVSNCLHAYTEFPVYEKVAPGILRGTREVRRDYDRDLVIPSPMFNNGETIGMFDEDVNTLLDRHAFGLAQEHNPQGLPDLTNDRYQTGFFQSVVLPMMRAWKVWKEQKDPTYASYLLKKDIQVVGEYDWLVAGQEWMERRIK